MKSIRNEALSRRGMRHYRPNQRHEVGFLHSWKNMAGNVWKSRELIGQLFKRDFTAAYKKSFLGITWVFIMPAMGIASWVFLQRTGMLHPGELDIPYPVYVLVGTTIWGLFLGLYDGAARTLDAGKDLVMQVRYPHEAMLFQQVAHQLANFLIGFLLNLVVMLAFRIPPHPMAVLFPVVALPLAFLAIATGLIASMISIVAIDISNFVRLALGLLMWGTPIIYADTVDNALVQTLIRWNPLTYAVCSVRDIILFGRLYDPVGYTLTAILSVILLLWSWRLFYVSEDRIIERMI